jgi:hypothetical protein
VPFPIINLGVAYGRTQPEAYDEQLAVVWDQKQELGTERFCAALQPRLEPLFPEMLVKARQAGFGDTSGGTFGGQDVEKILATYKANSLRFDRDYLGQSLEIIWPFKTATKTYAEFGTRSQRMALDVAHGEGGHRRATLLPQRASYNDPFKYVPNYEVTLRFGLRESLLCSACLGARSVCALQFIAFVHLVRGTGVVVIAGHAQTRQLLSRSRTRRARIPR